VIGGRSSVVGFQFLVSLFSHEEYEEHKGAMDEQLSLRGLRELCGEGSGLRAPPALVADPA
jgi:hypothetical protein